MAQQEEKVPLLIPCSQEPPPIYPAYIPTQGCPQPLYNVGDARHLYSNQFFTTAPPQQPPGFTTLQIFAVIAIALAFVLLFGVVFFSNGHHKRVLNSMPLRQSAPEETPPVVPNPDIGGYKDISIPHGFIRGFTKKSRQGRDYTAYFKIPYAEPPIGDLRFKDTVPLQKGWTGLRAFTEPPLQCIQKEKYSDVVQAVGEEDCLYANVYVPPVGSGEVEPESQELLPVMVYIHGGGFTDGNGSRYGPDYFMDEDVIIVTFQYRLGPLGFLSTEDDVIRGNMGFKDQVQMLRWTKDNIQHFGGDPENVLIFGNSAGGMSVSFLMVSPMASGLFHRAITQSGASICANLDITFDRHPNNTVAEVERELGCSAKNTQEFLECLQSKDAHDIALVRTNKTLYGLTIERRDLNQDQNNFMPDNFYNLARDNPNKVPYMLGVVNGEWTNQALGYLSSEPLVSLLNRYWDRVGGAVLYGLDLPREELASIKNFYFGDKEIGNATEREMIAMVSDRGLIHCTYVSAQLHGQHSPTYLYYVTKPPYLSYTEKAFPGYPMKEKGLLSHADELQYFFKYDGYPEIKVGDEEYFEFSRDLVQIWAKFAKDGKPQEEWQRATSGGGGEGEEGNGEVFWFEFGETFGKTDKINRNMDFWNGFTHEQLKYTE